MTVKRKARLDDATSERAAQGGTTFAHFIAEDRICQAGTVSKLLSPGKAGAITGAELVKLLGLPDLRALTQLVELERRAGIPICASTNSATPGYFLAETPEELEEYLLSLDRRLHNIRKTRQHLEDTLRRLTAQEQIEGGV